MIWITVYVLVPFLNLPNLLTSRSLQVVVFLYFEVLVVTSGREDWGGLNSFWLALEFPGNCVFRAIARTLEYAA